MSVAELADTWLAGLVRPGTTVSVYGRVKDVGTPFDGTSRGG